MPERERLQEILEEVDINDPATYNEDIESLEREISDRASQRWTDSRTPTGRGPGGGARPPSKRRMIHHVTAARPPRVRAGELNTRKGGSKSGGATPRRKDHSEH